MTRRRKPSRSEPRHYKEYSSDDTRIMMLACFLLSNRDKGVTPTDAQNHFKNLRWTMNYDTIKETLEEMVRTKWVTVFEYGKRFTVYKITDEGVDAVNTAHKLIQQNNPICSLNIFRHLNANLSLDEFGASTLGI